MSRNAEQKKRLEWLDFWKSHGNSGGAGCPCRLLAGSPHLLWRYVLYAHLFSSRRATLFRRKEGESYGAFSLVKKAKRLLIPYFGTSAFLWLIFLSEGFRAERQSRRSEDTVSSGNPLFTESDVAEQLYRRESSALESSEFSVVVSDSSFSGLCLVWTNQ